MKLAVKKMAVGLMLVGFGVALGITPANAEDVGQASIPSSAAEPGTSLSLSPEGSKHVAHSENFKHSLKKNELELNWNAALGTASYTENDQAYDLSSGGLMLEINPGAKVTTAPGLDIGLSIGFVVLSSTGSFSADYDGPPEYTRNWTVEAISAGTFAMAKYSYDIDFGLIKLGLENGVGLGYFINHVSADWVDADDDDIEGNVSDDVEGWFPVVRAGLKLVLPVTEVSCLGLNVGGNLLPFSAGDYASFLTTSVGLNYQVAF